MPNVKRGRGERDKSLGLANGPWEVSMHALCCSAEAKM